MGGLITSYYLLDHSDAFQGAVISAPFITVPDNINRGIIIATKILSRVAPKMGMMRLNANDISRDPEVVRAYLEDPLVFNGKTSVRMMAEMLKEMIKVNDEMEHISLPLILVQGGADKLADPIGAKTLYELQIKLWYLIASVEPLINILDLVDQADIAARFLDADNFKKQVRVINGG